MPKSSDDRVVVHEAATKNEIAQFDICRIIFFARGTTGTYLVILKHLFCCLITFSQIFCM